MAQTVFNLTCEEVEQGLADPPRPRQHFDVIYGVGGWRPRLRHAIWQQSKWRPMHDGKRAHTNALGSLEEAIVCIPGELIILAAKKPHKDSQEALREHAALAGSQGLPRRLVEGVPPAVPVEGTHMPRYHSCAAPPHSRVALLTTKRSPVRTWVLQQSIRQDHYAWQGTTPTIQEP